MRHKLETKHCVQHITHKFDQALTLQSALLDFFFAPRRSASGRALCFAPPFEPDSPTKAFNLDLHQLKSFEGPPNYLVGPPLADLDGKFHFVIFLGNLSPLMIPAEKFSAPTQLLNNKPKKVHHIFLKSHNLCNVQSKAKKYIKHVSCLEVTDTFYFFRYDQHEEA